MRGGTSTNPLPPLPRRCQCRIAVQVSESVCVQVITGHCKRQSRTDEVMKRDSGSLSRAPSIQIGMIRVLLAVESARYSSRPPPRVESKRERRGDATHAIADRLDWRIIQIVITHLCDFQRGKESQAVVGTKFNN